MSRATILALGLALSCGLAAPAAAATDRVRPDLHECEGCEAIHEHAFEGLPWSVVIPPRGEPGERLVLTGRVLRSDGRTPTPGVILYVHHTNAAGVYPTRGGEKGWARRHGYLRGWVRTNEAGDYRFETICPAPYPGRAEPAHIHITVKEPGRREYWIDDVVFADDPLVTPQYRARAPGRGGSGIVAPTRDATGGWAVRRDIVLEP